jgi:hypothetical protein
MQLTQYAKQVNGDSQLQLVELSFFMGDMDIKTTMF